MKFIFLSVNFFQNFIQSLTNLTYFFQFHIWVRGKENMPLENLYEFKTEILFL